MSKGYVYILFNPAFQTNQYKIGKTTKRPEVRAREISAATGVPRDFQVLYEDKVVDCERAERLIHQRLHECRSSTSREFFELPLKDAIDAVRQVAEEVGRLSDPDKAEDNAETASGKDAPSVASGEITVIPPEPRRRSKSRAVTGTSVTFDDHSAYTDTPRREILIQHRRRILSLDDRMRKGEVCTLRQRIAYKIPGDSVFLEVKVQRAAIVLHLVDAGVPDPAGIASSIPESHGWGQLEKRIKITTTAEAEQAMPFVEAAYRSRAART